MENKLIKCGKLNISNKGPFTLIAGPCQLENEKHALEMASKLKEITQKLKVGLIYKTSFDKHKYLAIRNNYLVKENLCTRRNVRFIISKY